MATTKTIHNHNHTTANCKSLKLDQKPTNEYQYSKQIVIKFEKYRSWGQTECQ